VPVSQWILDLRASENHDVERHFLREGYIEACVAGGVRGRRGGRVARWDGVAA